MATTNFCVRMDSNLKKECEALYEELGLTLTGAINVFLRQSLRAGGFPFDVRLEQQKKETRKTPSQAECKARESFKKNCSNVKEALDAFKD